MSRSILIRGARQLVTLHGPPIPRRGSDLQNLGIIPDGALLIRDGTIQEVGTSRRVEALKAARGADEISAIGRVVLPGFVDCHAHLIAGPVRPPESAPEPRPETYWTTIEQTSPRTLETQALRLLDDFVRHGTTTIEAKSGFGLTERGELKILRAHAALNRRTCMLVSTFSAGRWLPPATSADEYVEWLCSYMLPLIRKRRLAQFADIYCDRGLLSIDQVRRYFTTAKELGFAVKMHAGQTPNAGAVAEAVRFRAGSIDHAVHVTDQDARLLAASDTIATLLPGPVFFLGTGRYAPARMLIDKGAAVALATNYNPQTSPSYSMQMMIALACRNMGMTVAEAISAATINSAYAMRGADRVGSLEAGKAADVVILAVPDYREIPYHFGVNLVELVMRRGQLVYKRPDVRWPPPP